MGAVVGCVVDGDMCVWTGEVMALPLFPALPCGYPDRQRRLTQVDNWNCLL